LLLARVQETNFDTNVQIHGGAVPLTHRIQLTANSKRVPDIVMYTALLLTNGQQQKYSVLRPTLG
jgi:hypothetical protein